MEQCCRSISLDQDMTNSSVKTYLAHTPNGRRLVSVSMSLDTSILSPIKAVGMLQALSTTWRPRRTSPCASSWEEVSGLGILVV